MRFVKYHYFGWRGHLCTCLEGIVKHFTLLGNDFWNIRYHYVKNPIVHCSVFNNVSNLYSLLWILLSCYFEDLQPTSNLISHEIVALKSWTMVSCESSCNFSWSYIIIFVFIFIYLSIYSVYFLKVCYVVIVWRNMYNLRLAKNSNFIWEMFKVPISPLFQQYLRKNMTQIQNLCHLGNLLFFYLLTIIVNIY